MSSVISIINMKGGVGKTTLSLGIGIQLSKNEKKVLLIDVDPQFNLTQALMKKYKKTEKKSNGETFYFNEILKKERTIYKLFLPNISLFNDKEKIDSDDLIVELDKNISLICGDLNLVLVNKSNDYSNIRKLKNFIHDNKLKEIYDYIIIDCHPTLTLYTDSALVASDYYLIPNQIDMYSIIGIQSLQKVIKALIEQERIKLKCLGLVYTRISKKNLKKEEEIKNEFEKKESVKDINIFNSKIMESTHLRTGKKGPIPNEYEDTKSDIESICIELEEEIKRNEELNKNV